MDQSSMKTLLEGKNPLWLPLLSGSMAPDLLPGDRLYIEPFTGKINRGDIAVFYGSNRFFSHRVLLIFPRGKKVRVLEKGDANRSGTFQGTDRVLGIVTKVDRNGILRTLSEPEERISAMKNVRHSLAVYLKYRMLPWKR